MFQLKLIAGSPMKKLKHMECRNPNVRNRESAESRTKASSNFRRSVFGRSVCLSASLGRFI